MTKKNKSKSRWAHTAKTILLAGFLLVASALFLSQAMPVFAHATTTPNIRGTMVLIDRSGTYTNNNYNDQTAAVSLPGTSCTIVASICSTTTYGAPQTVDLFVNGFKTTLTTINEEPHTYYSCYQTSAMPVPGGLATLNTYMNLKSLSYLTVAYDCTP